MRLSAGPPERSSSGYFHFNTKMLFISFALVLSQVYKEVLPEAAGHVLNVEAERRIQLPPIKPDRTDKGKTMSSFSGHLFNLLACFRKRSHVSFLFVTLNFILYWRAWQPTQHPCLENPMDRGAWRATSTGPQRAAGDWVIDRHVAS